MNINETELTKRIIDVINDPHLSDLVFRNDKYYDGLPIEQIRDANLILINPDDANYGIYWDVNLELIQPELIQEYLFGYLDLEDLHIPIYIY